MSTNSTLKTDESKKIKELISKKSALLLKGAHKHNNLSMIAKINDLKL
jgi:hypothetical protein